MFLQGFSLVRHPLLQGVMLSRSRRRLAVACFLMAALCVVVIQAARKHHALWQSGSTTVYKPLVPGTFLPNGARTSNNKGVTNNSFDVTPPPLPKEFVPLSEEVVDRVRKFVFFIGWGRSGSSIIASLLDSHPHIIIANEYWLIQKWWKNAFRFYHKKVRLFNELYQLSYKEAVSGIRADKEPLSKRGYTLNVKNMWQGQFKDYATVIGNKKAGQVVTHYLTDATHFQQVYKELVETVTIQVVALLVVRNPFDIAAKMVIYHDLHGDSNMRELANNYKMYRDDKELQVRIKFVIDSARAIDAMRQDPKLNLTVLEIHNADYVNDPKRTVQRICDFLEVECSKEYLQACEGKAFKSTFKTRQLVEWPPELRTLMEQEMGKFRMFDRYSFDSE